MADPVVDTYRGYQIRSTGVRYYVPAFGSDCELDTLAAVRAWIDRALAVDQL